MGPDRDIPGPEISAGSKVMSWWFDEYSKYKGFSPACVTGELARPAFGTRWVYPRPCVWREVYPCYQWTVLGALLWQCSSSHEYPCNDQAYAWVLLTVHGGGWPPPP